MHALLHSSASIITLFTSNEKQIYTNYSKTLMNLLKIVSKSFFCLFMYWHEIWKILLEYSTGSQKSASKRMYIELNEKIEKVSKLIYAAFVHWTLPGMMIPAFSMTVLNYFSSKPKESVYILPSFGV